MTSNTAEPLAFRCTRCFNSNCATTEEVGFDTQCIACGEELTVPDITPERIQLGYEFLEQHSGTNQTVVAEPALAEESMTDAEIFAAARREVRAGAGPEALVCSRMRRFLAHLVDSFCLLFAIGIGVGIAMAMDTSSAEGQVNPVLLIVMVAPTFILSLVNWCMIAMDGRTVGKYALNIKIVNLQGDPPGFFQGVLLRYWVTALLGMIPFFALIDAFWIFANEGKRCIHDFIAGTYVIEAS